MTGTQAQKGHVYLVGAGPGDPELLTLKAASLLGTADVVLHDDLVPPAVLSHANPRAWVQNVGKRCGKKSITQAEIQALMLDFAQRGLSVVRLKCGDPLVFGRAGEEIDALREAGVAFEVVPGITAAFAAAAALGCSLTDRRAASNIIFSSGHHAHAVAPHTPQVEPDVNDATRVVYMPGRDFRQLANEWRQNGLPDDLPCVVVSRAAHPDQQVRCTRLADLGEVVPGPAPTLLLAGWALRNLDFDSPTLEPQLLAAVAGALAEAP
jgi:uroporphyrin-III C-methyltransferase